MSLTHVHTPINLGPVTLKNRVVRTAHATNLGAGTMNDALIGYHRARAEGGWRAWRSRPGERPTSK